MAGPLPYLRFHEMAQHGGSFQPQAAIPFGNPPSLPADTDFVNFGFAGTPGTPGAYFNRGWRLITPALNALNNLLAMFTGTITLRRESGRMQLILRPEFTTFHLALRHMRVEFLNVPALVAYDNIDLTATRTLLSALPTSHPDLARTSLEHANAQRAEADEDGYVDWVALISDFFLDAISADESPFAITVTAGVQIAVMDTSSQHAPRKEATVVLKSGRLPGASNGVYLNPSFYVRGWPDYFADLSGGADAAHVMFRELMVVSWAPESNHHFRYVSRSGSSSGDFSDPSRPSGTIRGALAAADPHDTIVILDTGTYREDEIIIDKPVTVMGLSARDATDDSVSEGDFPRIDGRNSHRVIRVDDPELDGLVCLRSLTIENGQTRDLDSANKGYFGGAGVLINNHEKTLIENCFITRNQTEHDRRPAIDVFSMLSRITDSTKRLAIEALLNLMTAGLGATNLRSIPDYSHLAQSFGAGISTVYSSAYILRNRITRNVTSGGRGGGIGVALYSWPCIERNLLDHNQAGAPNRRDGGAIGCCVALPDQQGPELTSSGLLDDLFDYINLHVTPADLPNPLPFFTMSGTARKKAIRNAIYPVLKQFIRDRLPHWFLTANLNSARTKNIYIIDNRILNNTARDDGGAIYQSIMSQAYLVGNEIRENRALQGAGGGVRTTMASNSVLINNTIENNASNHDRRTTMSGGGGIAARNVQLEIRGGRIAENTANEFAGGAIYFNASDAGGLGIEEISIFHAILTVAYGFRATDLAIHSNVEITANRATGSHGKGGGIYVYRYDVVETPTLRVEVASYTSVVTSNSGGVAGADNFTLQDDQESVIIDDSSVGGYVTSGDLRYTSSTFVAP